jgi:glucuronoxylan 4-O-methyltransferase
MMEGDSIMGYVSPSQIGISKHTLLFDGYISRTKMRRYTSLLRRLFVYDDPQAASTQPFSPDVPANRPNTRLQKLIDQVRVSQGQLSNIEYGVVMGMLIHVAPASLLVFGQGRDSELWAELNKNGRTVFLEDQSEWIREIPETETYLVTYPGLSLPHTIETQKWDLIFVDGPMGYKPEHPGREESIRAAGRLAKSGGLVIVHDYDRRAEKSFCGHYLSRIASV